MKTFFITGTDTNIGKTHSTCLLSKALQGKGFSVIASKPLASGYAPNINQTYNEDALALQKSSSMQLDYNLINPICLEHPTAPHLAAQYQKTCIPENFLKNHLEQFKTIKADYHLIEGAGGWHVPINSNLTFGDLVIESNLEIILIVGIKLGCINHSLLTAKTIQQQQGNLIGWIANCVDPNMLFIDDTIKSIQKRLSAPLLSTIGYQDTHLAYHHLNLLIEND